MRLSWDAKASVLLERFSRAGMSRVQVKALDHDFSDKERKKVTPFGLYLPQSGELFLYFTQSKVTSDFIVDCLVDFWQSEGHRFPLVKQLLLNQDNGPENHSRRTQFMHRLTQFADTFHMTVELAYYPPYHSKYNPVERAWGHLEKHWNGSLLETLETVLNFAHTFRFREQAPAVRLVTNLYETGVKLSQEQMNQLELRLLRLPGLEKWFIQIPPLNTPLPV